MASREAWLAGDHLSLQHAKLEASLKILSYLLLRRWVCRPLLCIRQC